MRNKTKFASLFLALALSLASFAPVLAQTSSETPVRPGTTNNETSTRGENMRPKTAGEMAREQKLIDARKNAVKRLMDNQLSMIQKTVDRLGAIIEKIKVRRDKMSAEGGNVTALNRLIVQAEQEQAEVKVLLERAKTASAAMNNSADPRATAQAFMEAVKNLRAQLMELHKTLKDIVGNMRAASEEAKRTNNPGGVE